MLKPPQRKPAPEPDRPDRRQAILTAAERLFSDHGYHAVSLRQIAAQAQVPLALVGYYFGPKQALLAAVFEQWRWSLDRRLAELASISLEPGNPACLDAVVRAFLGPVLRLRASTEGEHYARLVARQLVLPDEQADAMLGALFDPLAQAFIKALHTLYPQRSKGQVALGYQLALGALMHHLVDQRIEHLSAGQMRAADPRGAQALHQFINGGLSALLGDSPPLPKTRRTTTRRPS